MYPPIADYAIIGDTCSAALVSSSGSIDWLCWPFFSSPAIFLRILDDKKGGFADIQVSGLKKCSRRYVKSTNILETRFDADTGTLVCRDFMPVHPDPNSRGQDVRADYQVIRALRCERGSVEFTLRVRPTFDFASQPARVRAESEDLSVFESQMGSLWVQHGGKATLREGEVSVANKLEAGERSSLVMAFAPPDKQPHEPRVHAEKMLEETRGYWERWIGLSRYKGGEYTEQVERSALTLKLLTFEPSGAIIAAPTTSLPEQIGGTRNWDYRYTWLRDATFTLVALMGLGYLYEAHDFLQFLHRAYSTTSGRLRVLYGIYAEEELAERELTHLDGYGGSKPVRVGNGADKQRQNDVFGELVHCLFLYSRLQGFEHLEQPLRQEIWRTISELSDDVVQSWRDPDRSIWEIRSHPRLFVYSQAMCWVALDRALRMAETERLNGHLDRWRRERDIIRRTVLEQGYNPEIGAFTQSFGSPNLDASALRLPLVGFIDARDSRMRSTIDVIARRLSKDGLLCRYGGFDDGIPGHEGSFAMCTFWLVENLAMIGEVDRADKLFRHVLSYANDVGLLSEEIDAKTGTLLGNFPQGFSHIALVNAALRLQAVHEGKQGRASALIENIRP